MSLRPTRRRQRPRARIFAGAYEIIAGIIREIEDPELRQVVADHFATAFNRRSRSFDPAMWEKATGGRPAPNSAA